MVTSSGETLLRWVRKGNKHLAWWEKETIWKEHLQAFHPFRSLRLTGESYIVGFHEAIKGIGNDMWKMKARQKLDSIVGFHEAIKGIGGMICEKREQDQNWRMKSGENICQISEFEERHGFVMEVPCSTTFIITFHLRRKPTRRLNIKKRGNIFQN